jgi:hypothetical protein
VLSWTNPDTSRADADCVVVPSAVVAVVVAIPADPDINALGLGGAVSGAVVSTATAVAAMKAIFIMSASSLV